MKSVNKKKNSLKNACSIGVDFGTNSVRAIVADVSNGKERGSGVFNYPTGSEGVILDASDHNLARQSPLDYIEGLRISIKTALKQASAYDISPDRIIGIGVDTTGSTPIPVDSDNRPMCANKNHSKNPNAFAWLWKDHTSIAEAVQITELAKKIRPEYLKKCGGVYSSEWYWAKLLHCAETDPKFFDETYAWIEMQDYIPAVLCGITRPEDIVPGVCAAGHKAMYNEAWGGYPDDKFLAKLNKKLVTAKSRIPGKAFAVDTIAGRLSAEWAKKLELPSGIPVATGAFDAHLGAVGSGIREGTLVKIVGTSTCDIMVAKNTGKTPDIPGVCGMVNGSVIPGYTAIEAGQSAVGDIFKWFANIICEGDDSTQASLTDKARRLKPGESGLVALDWNNGNRTILVNPELTGLILGMTLQTPRDHVYRALLEATAFGALTIINRIEEYSIKIKRVVCCGGISEKNDLFMQIYADVLNRKMYISKSAQTCALGAAIAGAVAGGAYKTIDSAIPKMTGVKPKIFAPIRKNVAVYKKLYEIYKRLHDAFGVSEKIAVRTVMKELLEIKRSALRQP